MLVKSCIFHYELQFIHPFEDGNGRMGRLWHAAILAKRYPVLRYLSFESLIREHQTSYYEALAASDSAGQSAPFVTFMLGILDKALEAMLRQGAPQLDTYGRLTLFISQLTEPCFTRKSYLEFYRTMSAPTASRDLRQGVKSRMLTKTGDKRTTRYCKPVE